jgi:hypothetical protein
MADLPAELAKAKPKTKAWLNKLRAVVKENAIVAGKNYTVNKHPGGTELVIDFSANLPRRRTSVNPYRLGTTNDGTDSADPLHPTAPDPNLANARSDVYTFGKPLSDLDGKVTDGVTGYLTRFYTSTMISYVKVFQRAFIFNTDGTLAYIDLEKEENVSL